MTDSKTLLPVESVIGVKALTEGQDIGHFFNRFHQSDLGRDFMVYRLSLDALRPQIQQYIIDHGLSSLFYNHLTCDALMHPGFTTDEIEAVVLGVMGSLNGVRELIIIDPYFYDDQPTCLALLEKILRAMGGSLLRVTLITNGQRKAARAAVHAVFATVIPGVELVDVVSEMFHDRYWIDKEKSKGVMVGTSLNGIGKKVAMIDYANPADTRDLIQLAAGLA